MGQRDRRALAPSHERVSPAARRSRKIATRPPFGLRLAKMSVNQALDVQGQPQAVRSAFSLHQIGHANNFHQHELLVIPDGPGDRPQ